MRVVDTQAFEPSPASFQGVQQQESEVESGAEIPTQALRCGLWVS